MTNPERRSALTANWALLVTVLLCAFLVIERVGAVIELAGSEFFSYPSLPFYMSAAAIKLGTWIEGPTELQRGHLFRIPGRQGEPHEPERLVLYARVLWALIGAALFVAVALLARQLSGSYTWAWIAPGILAFSELVQYQAVRYQNVDSPTSLFAVLTLIAVLHGWKSDSLWWKAVLPGILAGLTTACKYNSGLILAPCLLAILLAPGSTRFLTKAVVLGFTSAVTFFVVVPYSILDFNGFYEGVMYQVNHYRDGHPGFEGPTGLPQIWFYLTAFYKEFGITVSLLAIAGIFFSLKSRPRETLVVMAFPVLMILYMSTNKVHFLRTVYSAC
jgi:4-amino-4-deoxy-L-arabinose transferase-like glycosyltransferase